MNDHLRLNPFDVSRYTTAQVAAASGVSTDKLAGQLKRSEIALAEDDPVRSPGTGRSRLFSPRRALHIALTQALEEVGLPVGKASLLALAFTDHNLQDTGPDGKLPAATIISDGPISPNDTGRQPGFLFSHGGETIFRVLRERDGNLIASVDRVETLKDPLARDGVRYKSCVLINLTTLRADTLASLKFAS